MKVDDLGEYNENEIPNGLTVPLKVNASDDTVTDFFNQVIALYNFHEEQVLRGKARRRAEFVVRMANNEVLVYDGKVYERKVLSVQGNKIVCEYHQHGTLEMAETNGGKRKKK